MSFGIKPLGTRVVIRVVEVESKTKNGIVLSGQVKEQPQIAEVISVGAGTVKDKMELRVGDRVMFSKYAGVPVKYEDVEYLVVSQKDILAIVS